MPRIRLEERVKYRFMEEIPVRVYDLNVANHVGHSEIVNIVHEARSLIFRKYGFLEDDFGDGITGIIMTDMALNFIAEAFLGDILRIEVDFDEFQESGFRAFYRITNNRKLIALAETGIVAFNFEKRKKGIFPEKVMKAFNQ